MGSSQARKLSNKHFLHALKLVRASTSESQTSLVELRKWNDQFGSANHGKAAGHVAGHVAGYPAGHVAGHVAGNEAGHVAGTSQSTADSYLRELGLK